MKTICWNCGNYIVKTKDDDYRDWRHQESGSIYCPKVRGKKQTSAIPKSEVAK